MENLGSEIGQKMRHAVKAKLLELNTGNASGYVDDELPDYVMIMVANKRSRQQMVEDLTLFLGSNTEEFVNWLHQVLQKLQEVSLPPTLTQKTSSKRKASESTDTTHKKDKKKEKKTKKSTKSQASNSSSKSTSEKTRSTSSSAATTSITDVFANQLIQKAKKTLETEPALTIKKREATPEADRDKTPENDFDIPTITQISENTEATRRKELLELEEIQKKIYQAKRQLRNLTSDESEDEDFINLKADGEDFDEPDPKQSSDTLNESTAIQSTFRNPSPIVFDLPSARRASSSSDKEMSEPERPEPSPVKKTSVKDRLGSKPIAAAESSTAATSTKSNIISLSANRRSEKEIYIPAFRRREMEKVKEVAVKEKEVTKIRRVFDGAVEKTWRDKRDGKDQPKVAAVVKEVKPTVRQRIGSRVIVAPPKPEFDEDSVEVAVNSVVKIKPRPVLPIGQQANKNLLLRAMAEAQKSTAAAIAKKSLDKKFLSKSSRMSNKTNILIEVPRGDSSREDEYVPTPISNRHENDPELIYIPQTSCEDTEDEVIETHVVNDDEEEQKRPQFVVTLDGIFKGINDSLKKKKSSSPKGSRERVNEKKTVSVEPRSRETPKNSPAKKRESQERLRKGEVTPPPKRSLNDRDSSAQESETPEPPRKRRTRSPIRFDLDDKPKRRESPETPRKSHKTPEKDTEKNSKSDGDGHTVTIRKIETRKYENLPSLLSSITVPQPAVKPKERCKYFPSCTKGDSCEFIHPSLPCKSFPNCKFGDMCLYLHPKCKYDLTCSRLDCNFSHTPVISAAPPLASHVVPVNNYKMITQNLLPPLCKFYPKCSNISCNFYHPKLCRFGRACMNKVECNFYHYDLPAVDKFKWVSSGKESSTPV